MFRYRFIEKFKTNFVFITYLTNNGDTDNFISVR